MEREDFTNKIRFKQRFEGSQSASHMNIQRSILDTGNRQTTGPQKGLLLGCSRNIEVAKVAG